MKIRTDLYQAPLQDFMKPILDHSLRALQEILPQIHSIYLYGSAAKGRAILGKSDIDLTIILNKAISEKQQLKLTNLQSTLALQYPDITKIDFDFGQYDAVISEKELYRWGHWLKHCCRHLQGENLQPFFPIFEPSIAIAIALNQDYQRPVFCDLEKLEQSQTLQLSESAQTHLKNQICKRLIRASNSTRPKTATEWPYELDDYHKLFSKWHPEYHAQLHYFYQLLPKAHFSIKELSTHAQEFMRTLDSLINH